MFTGSLIRAAVQGQHTMGAMGTSERSVGNGAGLNDTVMGASGHKRNSEYWVHVVQSRVHQLTFP